MGFVKTHDISELNEDLIGKQVSLGGWIEDLRKLGKMSFITLRDVSGISQVIVKGELNDNLEEIIKKLNDFSYKKSKFLNKGSFFMS